MIEWSSGFQRDLRRDVSANADTRRTASIHVFRRMPSTLAAHLTRLENAFKCIPPNAPDIVNASLSLLDACDPQSWRHRTGGYTAYWSIMLQDDAIGQILAILPEAVKYDSENVTTPRFRMRRCRTWFDVFAISASSPFVPPHSCSNVSHWRRTSSLNPAMITKQSWRRSQVTYTV